jgi:hypothetical protein
MGRESSDKAFVIDPIDKGMAKFHAPGMSPRLSTLERLVIFAADEGGRIPMPCGEKNNMRTIRIALAHMKKKGLVYREKKTTSDCLPYALTESGRSVREDILTGREMH